MAIGPIGNTIYANQLMHLQATKQGEYQNRVDMQNAAAAELANEKEEDIQEVRPTEETYEIDPEKEHERKRREEEAREQEKKEALLNSEDEDEEVLSKSGHLDIKA